LATTSTPSGILVPLDGSLLAEQVLPYAQALLAPGAALLLLEVMEEPEPIPGMWGQELVPVEDIRRMLKDLAQDDLKRAEATLPGERPPVLLEVTGGEPAEQIVRIAAEHQVELIAMTTHGRGAMGRWFFGSVADRVARSATVPVLLLRPTEHEPGPASIRRLVVPLDGSALAEEALPTARKLAKRLGIPLLLVTVIDVLRHIPVPLSPFVAFDASAYQAAMAQFDARAAAMLDSASAELTRISEWLEREGMDVSSQVMHGSPFVEIAQALQEGDLLIMTSHGRSGVRRWLLGSVAEKLVRDAPVPVILVPVAARHSRLTAPVSIAH
jgi:nucleotide-binding universal stress UspA family protein